MKVPDYEREDPGELEQLTSFLEKVGEKTGVEASAALQPLLDRLSRQVELVSQALSRRLNAADNFNSDVRRVKFKDSEPRTIRPAINGEVREVRIRQTFPKGRSFPSGSSQRFGAGGKVESNEGRLTGFMVPRMLDWATTGRGEIMVVVKWDTAPVEAIDVELVIEGD